MSKQNMPRKAAGRILSAANETRLREARASLDEVLSKLEQEIAEDSDLHEHMNRVALKSGTVRVNSTTNSREAEMLIYGDIGGGWYDEGITAKGITEQIDQLDVDTLHVRVNSGGGLVFEGIAIYNALARSDAHIIMHVDGIAASIASVIMMAGDEIIISEGANVMIHKPWSFAMGDAESMRKEADILDKLEAGIIDIYEARTGAKRADLVAWVADETWFLGQEAVDAGFADEMAPAKKKKPANSALLNLFKNTPQNLLGAADSTPEVREFEIFLRDGEGLSNAQAKRIAAAMPRVNRDDSSTPQAKPLRDVGGESADAATSETASRLAQSISQFTNTIKE